jgi:hypothetical protein
MFKEKSSKKRLSTNQSTKETATLDARHHQKLLEISEHYDTLDSLRAQKVQMDSDIDATYLRIHQYKDDIDSPEYDKEWNNLVTMLDERVRIIKQIEELESSKEEIEYYENTGRILFKYYDVLDNQETNAVPKALPHPTTRKKSSSAPATRTILDAFAGNAPVAVAPSTSATATVAVAVDKSTLVDEYIASVDPHYLYEHSEDGLGQCPLCQPTTPLTCIQHEGVMICPSCGYQDILLVEQNRPLLRQVAKESTASYKRINHFREWCSQMQGKQCTDIPESIFEQILQELKKEKIVDKKKITYAKMREILKRLRVNKYYEHIMYIINRINGMPTPHFSPELEEKLCSMFKEIQGPFLNAVMKTAKERKNFLSYAYCLHQFFKILNLPDYLKYTTLLKSREKLFAQDVMFKHICEELGWPFFPTV